MMISDIIGIFNEYGYAEFVTIETLTEECEHNRCAYSMRQYLDRRCSTNLTRFNFDPFTGNMIDWSELKKKYVNEARGT